MSTDYRTIPVEDLLPHAGDMVLLDRILDYGEDFAVSRVKVTPLSRFYESDIGGIHSSIILALNLDVKISANFRKRRSQSESDKSIDNLLGASLYSFMILSRIIVLLWEVAGVQTAIVAGWLIFSLLLCNF